MDRRELNKMFDGLNPGPARERELLDRILQDDVRRKRPMKNWKRVVIGVAAAALLVTVAAAAVPGLSQKLLAYLEVPAKDSGAARLTAPGMLALDVTVEDSGMTLHVTQILRESRSIVVLADFTGPEGTALDYTGADQIHSWLSSVMPPRDETAGLLDKDGRRIEGSPEVGGWNWRVVADDDPADNHLTLVFHMELEPDNPYMEDAVSLRLPNAAVYQFAADGGLEQVYPGCWTCVVPLPQADTRWVLRPDGAVGVLDGAKITVETVSLSPASLDLIVRRDSPAIEDAEWLRWVGMGELGGKITLTTRDGRRIPVKLYMNDGSGDKLRRWWTYRLKEATDPAEFRGGALTLDWACGTITIPLDNLTPVEP